jgi:hypothetical protein
VLSAELSTVVPVILLRELAICRSILGNDLNKAVSELLDSVKEGGVGRRGGGVGAGGDSGRELTEECEGGRSDLDATLGFPDDDSVVELLRDGEGGEVPRLCIRELVGQHSQNDFQRVKILT